MKKVAKKLVPIRRKSQLHSKTLVLNQIHPMSDVQQNLNNENKKVYIGKGNHDELIRQIFKSKYALLYI